MHLFLTWKQETCSFGTIWVYSTLATASPIQRAVGGILCGSGCIMTNSAGLFLSQSGKLGRRHLRMVVISSVGLWSRSLTGLTSAPSSDRRVTVEVRFPEDCEWACFFFD